LEPVRQSGSGPAVRLRSGRTGQDRTRPDEKFIRPDETGFLPDFLPDFCQFDVKNEPDGFYRIFFDFLPVVCEISAGFLSV
jgi:hypothetical protein